MAERETFLGRWSRQKSAARENEDPPIESGTQEPPVAEPEQTVDLSALPDVDDLHAGSDFAAFMQPGVPDALRTRALRKLWTLDPAFSHLDGLVEYGEDFAAAYRTERVVRTVWQVGKGMTDLTADDPREAEAEGEIETTEADGPSDSETPPDPERTS